MRISNALSALSLAILLGFVCAVPAQAQQASHADDDIALTTAAMDAALAEHESAATRQRTQLTELLTNPQVEELASERGIDMERVQSMAEGLSDEEVSELAPMVTRATAALQARMGSVTISVAAIIVILLILILVS